MTVDPDHQIAEELDRLADAIEALQRRVTQLEDELIAERDWAPL